MVRILEVDDRPTNRGRLDGNLGDGSHRVSEAADGSGCLDPGRTESPDLVTGNAAQYERLLRHAADLEREIGERRRTEREP